MAGSFPDMRKGRMKAEGKKEAEGSQEFSNQIKLYLYGAFHTRRGGVTNTCK